MDARTADLLELDLEQMERNAKTATRFLKVLANPHRLMILCHLGGVERSVGDLEALLGLRQAHLSQQLAALRRAGLVRTRRQSRMVFYRLGSPEAEQTIALLYTLFCRSAAAPDVKPPARRAPRAATRATETR